ncbi:MAG: hypothetical protein V1754_11570 [Pseudomonadota bacterium]
MPAKTACLEDLRRPVGPKLSTAQFARANNFVQAGIAWMRLVTPRLAQMVVAIKANVLMAVLSPNVGRAVLPARLVNPQRSAKTKRVLLHPAILPIVLVVVRTEYARWSNPAPIVV